MKIYRSKATVLVIHPLRLRGAASREERKFITPVLVVNFRPSRLAAPESLRMLAVIVQSLALSPGTCRSCTQRLAARAQVW